MTVMSLVADVSRRRNLDGIDHPPVSARVRIEIHNSQKVRRDVRLIARPHVKHRFGVVSVLRGGVRDNNCHYHEDQQQSSKSVSHSNSPDQLLWDPTRGMTRKSNAAIPTRCVLGCGSFHARPLKLCLESWKYICTVLKWQWRS